MALICFEADKNSDLDLLMDASQTLQGEEYTKLLCLGLCSGFSRSFELGLNGISRIKPNWCEAFKFIREHGVAWSAQSIQMLQESSSLVSDEMFAGNLINHIMFFPGYGLTDICYLIRVPSHLSFVANCLSKFDEPDQLKQLAQILKHPSMRIDLYSDQTWGYLLKNDTDAAIAIVKLIDEKYKIVEIFNHIAMKTKMIKSILIVLLEGRFSDQMIISFIQYMKIHSIPLYICDDDGILFRCVRIALFANEFDLAKYIVYK